MADQQAPEPVSTPRAGTGFDVPKALLRTARRQVQMDVPWVSEFVGDAQVFRVVDAEDGVHAPSVGARASLSGSLCARVLDGRLPAVIPDTRLEPAAALLDVTHELSLGSYLGVPLVDADGSVTGMLCAATNAATPDLNERDLDTLRSLATVLHELRVSELSHQRVHDLRSALASEVQAVIAGEGRSVVVQPVVAATDGQVLFHEALSRFDSTRTPGQWFDAAQRLGMREQLEVAAARSALTLLRRDDRLRAVSINLHPQTCHGSVLQELLQGLDARRVVLEITEHAPVADYDRLAQALAPWRARGLRLAVDDAGAGYSSLQHVVMMRPDIIKLDMSLIRGVDEDVVRQALVESLVRFAAKVGSDIVAEGVETAAERDTVVSLGVPYLQGYLLGRPAAP